MKQTFFLTTPIYYVNDRPHIGHAYTSFACDAIARYHRSKGEHVLFSTGTDENSQKNIEAMEKAGETDASAYLLRMAETWKQTWRDLGISFDDFIRTTEDRHLKAVERFWKAAKASGDIYLGTYEGWYCTGCESFITEDDAKSGECPLHPGKPLKRIEEKNYFFKLSSYKEELLKYYNDHPDFIGPDARKNEIIRYVEDVMGDISVSREATSVAAGIPVPDDASQRIYVWFDALINYLTVAGFGTDDKKTREWWPADLHMVGKDIIKFHCALWPAMILSAAKSDPLLGEMKEKDALLPKRIFAHGFFTLNGQKISKSIGNIVDPRDLVPTYGLDAIRYFMLREMTFGEDGDFSYERLKERYASDLANTLGNLVQRTIAMSRKYFDGCVPPTDDTTSPSTEGWEGEKGIADLEAAFDKAMADFRNDKALELIWASLIKANKRIEDTKPFQLAKTDLAATGAVLYELLESIRHYAWMLEPVMPHVSELMIAALGQDFAQEQKKTLEERLAWGGLQSGSALPEPVPIFPRLETDEKSEK